MGVFIQGSDIKRESVRAKVTFGGNTWRTPDVKSFSVNLQRESLTNSFSVSLLINKDEVDEIQSNFDSISADDTDAGKIRIEVAFSSSSTPSDFNPLFTGYVRQMVARRSFLTPGSFIVDLSGNDAMYKLENRTYSRRVVSDGLGVYSLITGVVRKGTGNTGRYSTSSETPSRVGGRGSSPPADLVGLVGSPTVNDGHTTKASRYNKVYDFARTGGSGGSGTTTTTTDELVISPAILVMAPQQTATFVCASGCTESEESDAYTWSVDTIGAGGIVSGSNAVSSYDQANPSAGITYKQLAFLNNVLYLTENSSGRRGKAIIVTMPIHDHTSIGQGGPAFGVYASIEE